MSKLSEKIRNFNIKNCRVNFNDTMSKLESNGKILGIAVICAIVLMLLTCLAVFFLTVKGEEQMSVPNLEGKEWSAAEIEMQQKELYPRIQLRYTDDPNDEGKVISQSPKAGSIVKAGTRINLVISRGVIIDSVGDYIGKNLDDVRGELISMFAGSTRPLIVLSEPVYKADQEPLGTILEQDPPAGTSISSPVTVKLIVSRGPEFENTRPPYLVGKQIDDIYALMRSSKVIFDFKSLPTNHSTEYGTVVSQQEFEEEYIANYTRMEVTVGLPKNGKATINKIDYMFGIFSANLPAYPYAVDMTLYAAHADGSREALVSFKHTGTSVTVPYCLDEEVDLILSVAGKDVSRYSVN